MPTGNLDGNSNGDSSIGNSNEQEGDTNPNDLHDDSSGNDDSGGNESQPLQQSPIGNSTVVAEGRQMDNLPSGDGLGGGNLVANQVGHNSMSNVVGGWGQSMEIHVPGVFMRGNARLRPNAIGIRPMGNSILAVNGQLWPFNRNGLLSNSTMSVLGATAFPNVGAGTCARRSS